MQYLIWIKFVSILTYLYLQITVDLFKERCTELFLLLVSDQFIEPIQVNSIDISSFDSDIDGCVQDHR